MASNITTPKEIVAKMAESVKAVRDAIAGEAVLKFKENQMVYLPHPCENKKDEAEWQARYDRYLNGAEYDNAPASTLSALLGAVFRVAPEVEQIPQSLAELEQNADGDGLTLSEHIQITASECLQMEFCGLLTEFTFIDEEEADQLTIQQARALGLSPSIKHYPRESIINWHFAKRGGRLVLDAVILLETESVLNEDYTITEETRYLLLALDGDGRYFQRLFDEDGEPVTDEIYPEANGSKFDRIPFQFVTAKEYPKGKIPDHLGYLESVVDKSLHRYRAFADLKEILFVAGVPVSWSKGWTEHNFEQYKEMTGNDYIETSPYSHVPLPQDAEIGLLDWNADSNAYFKYLEMNGKQIRASGGSFDDTDGDNELATVKIINRAEKNGVLSTLASNIEQAYERALSWALDFVGGSGDIQIRINREFTQTKLTPQERAAILNEYREGIIGRDEALRQLQRGDILTKTADDILNEIELSGG